jgi:hypothetical protein
MPDPLLFNLDFDADLKTSREVAVFYGADIQQNDRFIFLQCSGYNNQAFLARIDCTAYPQRHPDVTFLNPLTRQPTVESRFWPPGVGQINGPAGRGVCMAGTWTYAMNHPDSPIRHSLATIVELVILCCKNQIQKLQLIPGR